MGKFLKKNWFLCLIVALLLGVSVFYVYDTNKGKLKGKTVNGEPVAYSISDKDVTASMFYDEMFDMGGNDTIVSLMTQQIAAQGIETTDEIKTQAKAQADQIKESYMSEYGENYMDQLNVDLMTTGFTDLEEYFVYQTKLSHLTADYAKKNFDDLKIRRISYILVQFEQNEGEADAELTDESLIAEDEHDHESEEAKTNEPTADEAARMKAVDDAFAEGKDFAAVATEFSEDASTAPNGGILGVVDVNATALDSAFLDAALALNEGEVSDWVYSENFGYFRIKCDANTPESVEAISENEDPYLSLISSYDSSLQGKAIWDKAQELGLDFHGDAELEKNVKNMLGFTEEAE